VTPEHCEPWRGLLALDAIGELPATELASLEAHLAGCAPCRRERDELARVAPVLSRADPDHFEDHQMPARLEGAVLTRLSADARRERRRRRVWVASGAAAGAAAAAVVLVLSLALTSSPTPGHSFALRGSHGASAQVRLTSEPWGTAVHLTERGQGGGQVLWVSMRTTSGNWWAAGTYTTVAGHGATVDMACALPASEITGIWVRDAQGHTVLQGYADAA